MTHKFEPNADKSNVVYEFELPPQNYYGVLTAAKTQDAVGNEYCWWGIESWDGWYWWQIGEDLFDALVDHEKTA